MAEWSNPEETHPVITSRRIGSLLKAISQKIVENVFIKNIISDGFADFVVKLGIMCDEIQNTLQFNRNKVGNIGESMCRMEQPCIVSN